MKNIATITKKEIISGDFPLHKIIENSVFYPCSAMDGSVIKNLSKEYRSFVYCDYSIGKEEFEKNINTFRGYKLLASRYIERSELIPEGWIPELSEPYSLSGYMRNAMDIQPSFACWAVYRRLPEFDKTHGPYRFSLLFINGEAAATYQALYCSNKKTAKSVVIVNNGAGFGGNYCDFRKSSSVLAQIVMNNPFGQPDIVICNSEYPLFNWENYEFACIDPQIYGYNGQKSNPGTGCGYVFQLKSET